MDGGGFLSGDFRQPFGRPSRRRRQKAAQLHLSQKGQNAIENGSFTGTRTAGNQQQSGSCRFPDGLTLFVRIFHTAFLFRRPDFLLQAMRCGERQSGKFRQASGAVTFRFIESGQVDHRDSCQTLLFQSVCFQQPCNSLPYALRFHRKQLTCGRHQLVLRQEAVSGG